MKPSRIVVIGASAGALDVLQTILEGLSAPFPAAVCVVVHGGQDSDTPFTPSLRRPGRLPVKLARDGEPLSAGVIFIAAPDRHFLVKEGLVRVTRGPRENLWRPAIDVLFRSAAVGYGPNVVGVLLSGAVDDGREGLAAVKRCGGVTVVQELPDRSRSEPIGGARRAVCADHVLPTRDIPALIEQLLAAESRPEANIPKVLRREMHRSETGQRAKAAPSDVGNGELTAFACPQCRGPLWARRGAALEFHCQVGHVTSEDLVESALATHLEAALWSAIHGFEQRASLCTLMADQAVHRERGRLARYHRELAATAQRHAESLRALWMAETAATDEPGERAEPAEHAETAEPAGAAGPREASGSLNGSLLNDAR